ncbi:MAG: S-layer homology domain-containing protein [Candidatus Bipolaricaulota bacterium]|nr:S-layer homology domain-containing protein [Candidatus Bipolaricaulota bacterium]
MKRTATIVLASALLCAVLGLAALAQTGNGTAEPVNTGGLFTDVPKDHWAYADLEFLAQRGIITGLPGGKFDGDSAMTRYSAAVYIARAIKYMQNNPESVTPADIETLKTLIFQVSDSVTTLQAQSGTANLSSLEGRVAKNEQDIAKLNAQRQIDGTPGTSALEKRVQGVFILSLTALLVGIAALAVATLGL